VARRYSSRGIPQAKRVGITEVGERQGSDDWAAGMGFHCGHGYWQPQIPGVRASCLLTKSPLIKWLFRHFAGALAIDEVAYGPDYHAMARVIRTYEQGGSPRRNSNCRDRPVDSRLAAWAQHRRCP
jgi:hypothetical protein